MQLAIALAAAVALQDVTIIDTITGKALPRRTVVVRDNKVAAILSKPPRDAQVVNASGKFLIPGLWDMHIHIRGGAESVPDNEAFLKLYVANGVTGVREMGGDLSNQVFAWRKEIEAGQRLGPKIFTSGPKLDGPKPSWPGSLSVTTPDEGRKAVRQLHEMGADFVKLYFDSVDPNIIRSIAYEASLWKMPVAGHGARNLTLRELVDSGVRDVQHARYYIMAGGSTDEGMIAREFEKRRESPKPMNFDEWTKRLLEEYNPAQERAILDLLGRRGAWVTPTLVVGEAGAGMGLRNYNDDPRRKYIPPVIWKSWDPDTGRRRTPAPDIRSHRALLQRKALELVPRMRDANIRLLAGSDCGHSNNYVFPGWSIHEELSLLRDAGLTNAEALRTATINAARYFNVEAMYGSIKENKAADLVLLDANPLVDIRNTTRIAGVVVHGRWLDRAALDNLLAEVEASARTR